MSQTVSSDSVAQDQIRAFIERIERMEEEKKAIADDIREIYAEAKGNGFSVPVLREIVKIRKQDHQERLEREALLDLYMAALGMQAAPRDDDDHDDDPPRGARCSSEHRPAALEMPRQQIFKSEPASTPAHSSVTTPLADESVVSREVVDAALPATNSPEMANDVLLRGGDSPQKNSSAHGEHDNHVTPTAGDWMGGAEPPMHEAGSGVPDDSDRLEHARSAISHADLTDKPGAEQSAPAPLARLKTTDEVADDMGLPTEVHPGCRKPKVCGRFSHKGLCAICRGEQAVAA